MGGGSDPDTVGPHRINLERGPPEGGRGDAEPRDNFPVFMKISGWMSHYETSKFWMDVAFRFVIIDVLDARYMSIAEVLNQWNPLEQQRKLLVVFLVNRISRFLEINFPIVGNYYQSFTVFPPRHRADPT